MGNLRRKMWSWSISSSLKIIIIILYKNKSFPPHAMKALGEREALP
jgi:hypothetical protein